MRHLTLLGAALLALSACAENDSPLAPADTPEGAEALTAGGLPGTLLYSSGGGNGQLDLFTIKPDGSGRVHLTSFPDDEFFCAWSWDNQQIVMVRPRPDGSNTTHHEPFIVDKNGNNGHWLTASPLGVDIEDLAWSPDGKRILANTDADVHQLMAFDVAAGTAQSLGKEGRSPSYDPTGAFVVYSTDLTLTIVDAKTFAPVRTIPRPKGNLVRHPSFSPDGKRIAFTAGPGGLGDIWVTKVDGTGMSRLVGGPNTEFRPTWSPDGLTIAYLSNRQGDIELWRVPASGGKKTQITTGGAGTPSWSH
jgi:hypothetical protein